MAATMTINETHQVGDTLKMYFGTIAFDSSYPTGGEALDPSANEIMKTVICAPGPAAASGFGYQFQWDQPNQKLLVSYNDYDAMADGPHIQVPNTTDLSSLTAVPFVAWGS